MYAIVDVETTGGGKNGGRITEIAVFRHDGTQIVEEFVSLVNPECYIPPFITNLTGISNQMVENAPLFGEIAQRILDITSDAIFVAHNVLFDYNCLKAEFEALGYRFERPRLCTVKMSRKLLPGHDSYSLGNLTADLGIEINGRHRAGGDAFATTKLFDLLLKKNGGVFLSDDPTRLFDFSGVNPALKASSLVSLPDKPGVMVLYDEAGKALSIESVSSAREFMFKTIGGIKKKKRDVELAESCADFEFFDSYTDFSRDFLHVLKVNDLKPRFNKLYKGFSLVGLFKYRGTNGYDGFVVKKFNFESSVIQLFSSINDYISWAEKNDSHYKLGFPAVAGLAGSTDGLLNTARNGDGGEDADAYNARINAFISTFPAISPNMVVVDSSGRGDKSFFVVVTQWRISGFGYADSDVQVTSIDDLRPLIKRVSGDWPTSSFVLFHAKRNPYLKIFSF
jgi:DNA polymerase-3 subunit epsilon